MALILKYMKVKVAVIFVFSVAWPIELKRSVANRVKAPFLQQPCDHDRVI